MVLHGKGSQYKLRKEYQELREEGLVDRGKLTDDEKDDADIEFPDGGGRTDEDTFEKDQFPYSEKPEKYNRRNLPKYG